MSVVILRRRRGVSGGISCDPVVGSWSVPSIHAGSLLAIQTTNLVCSVAYEGGVYWGEKYWGEDYFVNRIEGAGVKHGVSPVVQTLSVTATGTKIKISPIPIAIDLTATVAGTTLKDKIAKVVFSVTKAHTKISCSPVTGAWSVPTVVSHYGNLVGVTPITVTCTVVGVASKVGVSPVTGTWSVVPPLISEVDRFITATPVSMVMSAKTPSIPGVPAAEVSEVIWVNVGEEIASWTTEKEESSTWVGVS